MTLSAVSDLASVSGVLAPIKMMLLTDRWREFQFECSHPQMHVNLSAHAALKQASQKRLFFQKLMLLWQFELEEPNQYLQNCLSVLPVPAGNLVVSCASPKEECQPAGVCFMP